MGNVIKINDGFKTYDIVNQDNKLLGQFSFNPSDTNIIKRYRTRFRRNKHILLNKRSKK